MCATPLYITQATVKILLNSEIGDVYLSWLTSNHPFLRRNHTNHLVASEIAQCLHQILTLLRIDWFANSIRDTTPS